MMKEIKAIFDPENLLNPGVILNDNPHIHLENLKPMAPVHPVVDKCIECGFCDSVCVSTDLTLSPRQRIVVLREMERLKGNGHEPHILASLNRDFDYGGNQTCATDGLCAINCPVKIDTGEMIKTIRSEKIRPVNQRLAGFMASHTRFVVRSAAWGLSMVYFFHTLLGEKFLKALSSGLRRLTGNRLPQWNRYFPKGAPHVRKDNSAQDANPKVVYFPSCINRGMGVSKDYDEKVALSEKMTILLKKAGYDIIYPEKLNSLCCGMAYSSKGYKEQGKQKSDELERALRVASRNGEYPILCDMSPCLFTMKSNMEPGLRLYEPIEFILEFLTDKLDFHPVDDKIGVFSVCSAKKMGLEAQLVKLAKMCSTQVVDMEANCCGFAGDRGFTYPELNAHGLRALKEQAKDCSAGYSTSRTCEIGLSLHSDVSFKSIIYLVDKVTSPKVKSPPG
jgi:D-lactate dehydrogenase